MNAMLSVPAGRDERLDAFRDAVADDLVLLASLHHAEVDDRVLLDLALARFPREPGLRLRSAQARDAAKAMVDALDELSLPVPRDTLDVLAADYAAIYLNNDYGASPHESFWIDEENLLMQAPMFEVRAFYREHGMAAADWRRRADDHLVIELLFLAKLLREQPADVLDEAARFMDEHLLRWLPRFCERVARRCATSFYAASAWLTAAYCDDLRDALAEILGTPRPSPEEIEARMKPAAVQNAVPIKFVPGAAPSW